MNDTELRINNIVGRKYSNPNPKGTTIEIEPCFIKEIRSVNVNITLSLKDKSVLSKVSYGSIEPIELTEEWLIKFGFELNGSMYSKYPDTVIDEKLLWIGIYSDKMEYDAEFYCPKYVHQLQNFYFALTGKELTL